MRPVLVVADGRTIWSMDFPVELMLKAVEGHDDLIAFRHDFTLAGKALEDGAAAPVVTELEDGDLLIEGYAAVYDGMDRQGENFTDGAFQRGIANFLSGQAALCYHHQHDKLLGKVLDLREEEGKGLFMKARVDGAIRSHPVLGTIYQQIKRGSLNALSTYGYFKRALTEAGMKIVDTDLTEISITPVPVHPGTNFAVVAGKALTSDLSVPQGVADPNLSETEIRDEDFWALQEAVNIIGRISDRLSNRGSGSAASSSTID